MTSVHADPEMAEFAVGEAVGPAMSRNKLADSRSRVIVQQFEPVCFSPLSDEFFAQVQNPSVHLIQPMGTGLLLHVGNHGGEGMSGTVVAELEPLDATGRSRDGDDIFAFVSFLVPRCRESFALNGEQQVELAVPSPLYDQRGPPWFRGKVNFPAPARFVAGLGSKLHMTPDDREVSGTVEVIAKELGQVGLGSRVWTVGMVAPARKFVGDESYELQFRG